MIKNNFLSFIGALAFIFVVSACKKDSSQEDQLTLTVSPPETFITVAPGQIKNFTITGSSPVKLQRLKITFKTSNGALSTLLDSVLEVKNFTMVYPFRVPNYGTLDVSISMYFELIDSDGNSINVSKGIDVNYPNRLLAATIDNELFSRLSGQPSAYNLRATTSLNYTIPSTEDMNITDSVQVDSLSRQWISPAGGQFVRKNNFSFGAATVDHLRNEYEASAKSNKIIGLKIGDILLYKQIYGIEVFYAAIKITDIQNNAGTANDKYIFDLKK